MKISSIILLLLYCVLMFATLFVKNDKLKLTKLPAVLGIIIAIVHTVFFCCAEPLGNIADKPCTIYVLWNCQRLNFEKNTYIALGSTIYCVCCYIRFICNLATLFTDLDGI